MSAIPATSVNLKTMADGTLRISFDIEPIHAQDAFKLFAAPGTQAAIAALKAGAYVEQQAQSEKPRGGDLARMAGVFCADPKFWAWINGVSDDYVSNESEAAAWVRRTCDIDSRAELDHNKEAADYFHQGIRRPYVDYVQFLGTVKPARGELKDAAK